MCKKYCRAGQTTGDNMTNAHCGAVYLRINNILRICNNYRFATATMVARTRFSVALYAHFCLIFLFVIISIEIIQRRWQLNENRPLMEWQQGKTYVFGERLPQRLFVHHKFHMVSHDIKPGILRWGTVDSPPEVWHGLDGMYFDKDVAAHQWTPKRCFTPKYTT